MIHARSLLCVALSSLAVACTPDVPQPPPVTRLEARVVATGIPGAGAVAPVGSFLAGGPIHDKPEFVATTEPGRILDAARVLVASTATFGAPAALSGKAAGAILSIDLSGPSGSGGAAPIAVPADFAAADGQASAESGKVQLFSAGSPKFLNGVNNAGAVTKDMPPVGLPLSISINNAFGRPWFANAPAGAGGDGTISVVDPSGSPLAGAPSMTAGGVFSGALTNRMPQLAPGDLGRGAVATALLGKSPDQSGRAVFAAVMADGGLAQVHVAQGVDGLAPAGTIAPLGELSPASLASTDPARATRVGVAFNWVPSRILYLTDPGKDRLVALDLSDDGKLFQAAAPRYLAAPELHNPVDLAPAVPEIANPGFSSNSSLAGGADLYVLCRADATIVRMSQAGKVVAVREIAVGGARPAGVAGIAVSPDAQKIYVTAAGAGSATGGVLLEMPAFGAPLASSSARAAALGNGGAALAMEEQGRRFFP